MDRDGLNDVTHNGFGRLVVFIITKIQLLFILLFAREFLLTEVNNLSDLKNEHILSTLLLNI